MGASVAHRRIGDRRDERDDRSFAPDARGFTPLHLAAWDGRNDLVRELLAAGAPVDVRSVHRRCCSGATPLHLAVAAGRTAAAELLLAAGADPANRDEAGWTPLHLAADRGDVEMVRVLLHAKAPVDVWVGDATPLDLARDRRHAAVIGLLRQRGAR